MGLDKAFWDAMEKDKEFGKKYLNDSTVANKIHDREWDIRYALYENYLSAIIRLINEYEEAYDKEENPLEKEYIRHYLNEAYQTKHGLDHHCS